MIFTTDQTIASHLERRYLQWALIHNQYAAILSMDVNGYIKPTWVCRKMGYSSIFFHGES